MGLCLGLLCLRDLGLLCLRGLGLLCLLLGLIAFLLVVFAFASLAAIFAATMTVALFGELCYRLIFRSLAKFGRYRELGDFLLKELLYLLEIVEVGLAYKGDGATITVGTCRTTYAMHIVLYIMRHIIIDDHLNVVDVDTTSHNISSHKHIYFAGS